MTKAANGCMRASTDAPGMHARMHACMQTTHVHACLLCGMCQLSIASSVCMRYLCACPCLEHVRGQTVLHACWQGAERQHSGLDRAAALCHQDGISHMTSMDLADRILLTASHDGVVKAWK